MGQGLVHQQVQLIDIMVSLFAVSRSRKNLPGVRSGYTDMYTKYLRYAGLPGFYWANSTISDVTSYVLSFNVLSTKALQSQNNRNVGFSLRCLQE